MSPDIKFIAGVFLVSFVPCLFVMVWANKEDKGNPDYVGSIWAGASLCALLISSFALGIRLLLF